MQKKSLFFISIFLILFFALTPENMFDKKIFVHSDKIKHIFAFFLLSLLIELNKDKFKKIMILVLFAAIIEILQHLVGRQSSIIDFLFSCTGIFIYLYISKLLKKF